jgi:hypothetical protein
MRAGIAGTLDSPPLSAIVGFGMDAVTLDVTTAAFDAAVGLKREPLPLYVVRLVQQPHVPSSRVLTLEMLAPVGARVAFDVVCRVQVEGEGVCYFAPYGGRLLEMPAPKRATKSE